LRLLFATLLPHYQGKLRLARMIADSNTRPVVLMPSNFMQNDDVFRDDILAGHFPEPLAAVNRVDLRDVAQVAVRALCDDAFPAGRTRSSDRRRSAGAGAPSSGSRR